MKTFIADGSRFGLKRLLNLLDGIEHFELVGYAADAYGAIVSIRSVKPDLLILDLELRSGNGLTVLKSVKEDLPQTVVIVATNSTNEQYRTRCKELGADYFIDKSTEVFRIPELVRALGTSGTAEQRVPV